MKWKGYNWNGLAMVVCSIGFVFNMLIGFWIITVLFLIFMIINFIFLWFLIKKELVDGGKKKMMKNERKL